MSFLRKIFGLSSKETPLNSVKKIMTSKLPIPDVGGEYYIRFIAKKTGSTWTFDYETNCDFKCSGKTKSIDAFKTAKKNHSENGELGNCLETVVLMMADLENAHLRYSTASSASPIKQDNKTKKYHYINVLDKMPDEMQDTVSRRWDEYLEKFGANNILPPQNADTSKPKRSLPARRPNSGGTGHRHGH